MSDNELGVFLRSRREAITPAEMGLPAGQRRRTPGLRRTELAMLAGISVEYLARLEQGRDRHPSAQVLGALADTLLLSHQDRLILRRLAKATNGDPFGICPGALPPTRSVRPTVRMMLDLLEPTPALLINRLTDVLAFTSGYERLARPLGLLDESVPNLVRFLFTDPRAMTAYPDWDHVADAHAANLKAGPATTDQHLTEFVDELTITAGLPFTDRWKAVHDLPQLTGIQRVLHPEVGELRLAYETLELSGQHLLIYLPADDSTSTALNLLTGRHPGALRAVTG